MFPGWESVSCVAYHLETSRKCGAVSSSVSSKRGGAPKLRRWVIAGGVFLSAFVLFAIIRSQGSVRGVEFAPSHFQTREFQFYEIPFLHIQISPIKRTGVTSPTLASLRKNNWVKRPKTKPETWHVVSINRGASGLLPGDAQLLTDQLDLIDGSTSSYFWLNWSENHPNEAAALWPIVQRLAERELYILVPGLLQRVLLSEKTEPEFSDELKRWLLDQMASLIKDMRAAERDELADALLEEALVDFPDDPQLQQWRSEAESAKEDEQDSAPAES